MNENAVILGSAVRCRLLFAAAFAAAGAFAVDFSNRDGTGLLSNAGNWGGTLPDSSTGVTVAGPGSLSTAADVTTGNATLKGDGLAIALGAYSWAVNGYLYCEQAGTRVVLDGGTYTTTGEVRVDNGGAGNVHLVLTNGATVTSSGRFNCGWGGGFGSSLMVAGEGSSFVANNTTQAHLGNTSANHLIHVADHGNFETKSTPFNIGQGLSSANTNNMVLVETEGTATFHNTLNIGRANSSLLSGRNAGENKLIIRSGGKVVAENGINMGGKWHSPSNLVEVTDGGSLTVAGASFRVGGVGAQSDSSGSSWNRVRVVGGSYSQLYGAITIGDVNGNGYSSDYNSFFAGTNAAVDIANMLYVGNYGACNEAVFDGVTNSVAISGVTLGVQEGSSNNVFRASHVHSLTISTLTVGKNGNANRLEMADVTNLTINTLNVGANSWSNRVEIVGKRALSLTSVKMGGGASGGNYALIDAGTSGAALNLSGGFSQFSHLAGFGDEIELRNFTANSAISGSVQWGTNVTNATLRVGRGCVFNTTGYITLAFAGPGCRMVVDGADWTHGTSGAANDGYANIGYNFTDNHLEVVNGGKLIIKASTLALGNKDRSSITVGGGSEMEVYRIRVNGSDNRLTISNGTFRATEECSLPSTSIAVTVATNNVVSFLGDAPRLIGSGIDVNFYSRNASGSSGLVKNNYIHFAVPKGGYAADAPPVETTGSGKNIGISAGNFITADVSQFAKRGGKTLLMRASGTINITNLSELGSKLPANAVLSLGAGNKELWLRMPDRRGMRISLK
jgi:hypothetical protein